MVTIQDVLNSWADLGFFDYVLPFLLIFAIVFGILNGLRIFGKDSKGINAIIAVAIGLLSLQWGLVPQFFSEIFPRTGVALAVVLIFIILAGLFIDPSKGWIMYVLMGIGTVAAIATLKNTSNVLGWRSSYWVTENFQLLLWTLAFVIILIVVVASASGKKADPYKIPLHPWRAE